jgi:hypothetical protein
LIHFETKGSIKSSDIRQFSCFKHGSLSSIFCFIKRI